MLAAAHEQTAGPRVIAAQLAGILAWRGEPAETVRALLDHALDGNRLLAQIDSDPLIVVQALFAAVLLDERFGYGPARTAGPTCWRPS